MGYQVQQAIPSTERFIFPGFSSGFRVQHLSQDKASKTVPCPERSNIRHTIKREYIQKNAGFHFHMFLAYPHELRIIPPYSRIAPSVMRVCGIVLKEKPASIQILHTGCSEFFVFVPRHRDVKVVVPRNKPAVPHCPKHRPRKDAVFYAIFAANTIDFDKHLQQD